MVNKVSLFDELPAHAVGSILGYLRPEVYLPNDLIVRAGDFGDCMFFIANGTVAVFSLKGVEVGVATTSPTDGTTPIISMELTTN